MESIERKAKAWGSKPWVTNLITNLQGLRPETGQLLGSLTARLAQRCCHRLAHHPSKPRSETHGHSRRWPHTHLLSRADLLYSSYFCQGPLVGHNDIGATTMIHQCNAVNQKRKPNFLKKADECSENVWLFIY